MNYSTIAIRVVIIYRPPLTAAMTMNFFYGEFSSLMEQIITDPKSLIIFGDFNLHVDSPNDAAAIKFIDLLETFGLKQHINVATHQSGHTLDLVITRSDNDLVSSFDVTNLFDLFLFLRDNLN